MRWHALTRCCFCLVLALVAVPSSFITVSAKKEVKASPPIQAAIPFIRCGVCEHTMFQLVRNTLDYIAESGMVSSDSNRKPLKLREDRLLDNVIEPLCVPFTPGGAWLRGADWDVVAGDTALRFKLREGGNKNFECGPRCGSAAAACDALLMHGDNTDTISSLILKAFKKLVASVEKSRKQQQEQHGAEDEEDEDEDHNSEPVKIAKLLVKKVCRSPDNGKLWSKCPTSGSKKLPKSVLKAPALIPMEAKEVEVEEMMYRMKHGLKKTGTGGKGSVDDDDDDKYRRDGGAGAGAAAGTPGVDVFSRDEMMKMRTALRSGDRETLRELDPTSADLTDEEFEELTRLHQQEFGALNGKQKRGDDDDGDDDA